MEIWEMDITDPRQLAGQLHTLRIAVQGLLLGMPEPQQSKTASRLAALLERAHVQALNDDVHPKPPEWFDGFEAMKNELLRTHPSTRETGQPPDL